MKSTQTINVYDFDHTIYDGDISLDFIRYCLLHYPKTLLHLPRIAMYGLLFLLGLASSKTTKEVFFSVLSAIPNQEAAIEQFWLSAQKKIKKWYITQHSSSDVIISASPEFLLKPLSNIYPMTIIATTLDQKTGLIIGKNCYGAEKVHRLKRVNSNVVVESCYSDSLIDTPLLSLAKYPYIVKGSTLIPFDQYTPSIFSKLKSRVFLRFITIGGFNALLGILFSYSFSYVIPNTLVAFLAGYSLGILVSYPINGLLVFKKFQPSLHQFTSFCLSYVPNFLIQLTSVYVLSNYLHLAPFITYTLAVVISVPLTFLLLLHSTFKPSAKEP